MNCVGECHDNAKCTKCRVGWKGEFCTQPSCIGLDGMCLNDGNIYNYLGSCDETDTEYAKCHCGSKFAGRYCERGASPSQPVILY